MKTVRVVVQVVLAIAAVALTYMIYKGIMKPIDFESERQARYDDVINRLKDIRTAEVAYKSVYQKYTGSFDTLIHFVKTDSFPVEFKEGSLDDSIAVAKGLIRRDTIYVPVRDSLFAKGYVYDSLRYLPHSGGKEFSLQAGTITTQSKLVIHVFEANALNFEILKGMNRQLIINLNDIAKDFKGLRFGNMKEANNNAGNWE